MKKKLLPIICFLLISSTLIGQESEYSWMRIKNYPRNYYDIIESYQNYIDSI